MEQDPLDEDSFPRLASTSPVIKNNRQRKKSNKRSGAKSVRSEDNEVSSTTTSNLVAENEETKRGSPVIPKNSKISDKGDVPSPVDSTEKAILLEENAEEINCKKKTVEAENVKEKIVLCVDSFDDPAGSPFIFQNGKKHTTLSMIKRILTIFLKHKNAINCEHEFAIIELDGDSACWLNDFTSDIEKIIKAVENITPNGIERSSFDLTKLFDVIAENTIPTKVSETSGKSLPPFVIRVIVLYSRSQCIPELSTGTDSFELWSAYSQDRFLDTLYIHETPGNNNNCKKIHENLHGLERDSSYSFQVVRSAVNLHDSMAMLLAHPLQRADSSRAIYKLELIDLGRNGTS